MRYPATETAEKHARILEAASGLFRKRGFGGVSVGEIMRATGLTHGPFYNHFASKEALMAESLAHASATSLAALDVAGDSTTGLLAYVDDYLSATHRDMPEMGCLLASLASEGGREDGVRPVLTHHVAAVIARLARFWPGASKKAARREAIHAMSAMVGAMVLARAADDPALSDEILAGTRDAIRRSVRATTAR